MSDSAAESETGSEWRFSVDEVGPEAEAETEATVEPEQISLEQASFVVLGVVLSVGVVLTAL